MAETSREEVIVRLTSLIKSTGPPTEPDINSDSDHSIMTSPETADVADPPNEVVPPPKDDVAVAAADDDGNKKEEEQPEDGETDSQLLEKAEVLFKEDKILEAYNLVGKVKDTSLFSELHTKMIDMGKETEEGISDLLGPLAGSGWKQQSTGQGSRPSNVYTKLDEESHLSVLLETPIEASLLVPLLSVLNETDLYKTWMPDTGIRETKQLEQVGRVEQIIQVILELPWPLWAREFIVHAYAVDDIDDRSFIALPLTSLQEGPSVPEVAPQTKRLDFDGMLLFRACPADHELLAKQRQDELDEPMVLVSLKGKLYTDFSLIPTFLLNYVTKQLIGLLWSMLLGAADDIKAGKRPQHKEAIEAKSDLYRWVEQRANVMVSKLEKETMSSNEQEQFVSYLQS